MLQLTYWIGKSEIAPQLKEKMEKILPGVIREVWLDRQAVKEQEKDHAAVIAGQLPPKERDDQYITGTELRRIGRALAKEMAAAVNEVAAGTVTEREIFRSLLHLVRKEQVFTGMGFHGAMLCYLSGTDKRTEAG